MKSNSQKLKITAQLKEFGSVSRNWALSNFISRLGAIICDLTKEGWEFDTKYQTINGGKDYVYTVIKKPEDTTTKVSEVVNGQLKKSEELVSQVVKELQNSPEYKKEVEKMLFPSYPKLSKDNAIWKDL